MQALWFLILFLVLQQIEGNLVYPRVVGDSIGLPALWVLAAVLVGGSLFGILGMLAGVPAAAVIYVLIREAIAHRLHKQSKETVS
jgi:predicted PurR-regulated permease PerM